MAGTLFICATPIGNLQDCTFRLIETLRSAAVVAAEDCRVARILLQHYAIKTPLISLQKFNEMARIDTLCHYLTQNQNVALVTDAGTPAISDPGAILVHHVRQRGFNVVPIPGPSAITTLLSASGINSTEFVFLGFFPKKTAAAAALLNQHLGNLPLVFFESPERLQKTLLFLNTHYLIQELVLGKELTKRFETIISGSMDAVIDHLKTIPIKGEWLIILNGVTPKNPVADPICDVVSYLKEQGLSVKALSHLSKLLGWPKNTVYRYYQNLGNK